MPTIVEDMETRARYVLLGAGYGMFQSARPGIIFGDLIPNKTEGAVSVVAVCNADGRIGWLPTKQARVVEVDGVTLQEALE